MVSERYEEYLNKLLKRTEERKIKWRPIHEYIQYYADQDFVANYVQASLRDYIRNINEMCLTIYMDKSFFVQKDGYALAMLNYKTTDADGKAYDVLELAGGIYCNPVMIIPEYIEGGFAKIQNAIIQYWRSIVDDYKLDISDSFEVLSTFTEED